MYFDLCYSGSSHHSGSGLGGSTGSSHVSSHPSGTSPSSGSGTGTLSSVSGGQQHHGYQPTPNNSAVHHNSSSHHAHSHHSHGPVTQAQAISQAQAAHQAVSQALSHAESGAGGAIHPTPQSQPVEFNHAINYVNKIKVSRFLCCMEVHWLDWYHSVGYCCAVSDLKFFALYFLECFVVAFFGEGQECWVLSKYIKFILMGDIFLSCTVSGMYFLLFPFITSMTICFWCSYIVGACSGAVGRDTALQTRRPRVRFLMVSLEFFIYVILLVALWPWDWHTSLNRKEYQEYFLWDKGGQFIVLTPYHLHVMIVLKYESLNLLEPSGPIQACTEVTVSFPYFYIAVVPEM